MDYNILGNTNLRVSLISFGTATLGQEYGVIDPKEGERSVHYAIDRGINYFDVAPYYGGNLAEIRLGKALMGKRTDIILATKGGRYKTESGEYFDFSSKGILHAIDRSLKHLKTDYIDVYQLHDVEFVSREVIIEETLPTMIDLKKAGKIRFIGITGYSLKILKEFAAQYDIDVILSYSRYNLTDTTLNKILGNLVEKKGIGLINGSPLNMGLLTKAGPPDWHPVPKDVKRNVQLLRDYCDSQGVNIEKVALQFALNNKMVDTTLIGMSSTSHVNSNIRAMEDPVDSELVDKLLELIRPVKDFYWEEGIAENFDPGSLPKKYNGEVLKIQNHD